jgi:multicomponent Na+:H+ antiporter subunit D
MEVEAAGGYDLRGIMALEPTPAGDWLVIAPIILTLLAGSGLLTIRKRVDLQASLAIATLALLVVMTAALLIRVVEHGTIAMTMGRWLPPFGISLVADPLGASLTFIASVVALAVGIYAARDVDIGLRRYGFYPFLLLMMCGVCGAFLTGDVFNLYVWFEVLLISSFGLIVIGNTKAQLDGAVRYAILNLIATTLFLMATGLLYGSLGTLNMADIAMKLQTVDPDVPILTITALFILAFGMKAAAFPVNFWLPASYHTPAMAVSAVFAGLLTKVGAYALLRLLVMLMPAQRELYTEVLVLVAIATMITGVLGALAQSDLRRMLGFLVISGIGLILAGLAIGSPNGVAGAIIYAVHSMLVITALYMACGVAGRVGASFEMRELGGLYIASPLLAASFLVLVFGVAGLPPFSGFWPKVVLTQAALVEDRWWLAAAILLTGLMTTIAAGRAFVQSFWRGGPADTPDGTQLAIPPTLSRQDKAIFLAPLAGLTLIIVVLGVWPVPLLAIADAAATGLFEPTAYVDSVFAAEGSGFGGAAEAGGAGLEGDGAGDEGSEGP